LRLEAHARHIHHLVPGVGDIVGRS
jgi:hypothetical protein